MDPSFLKNYPASFKKKGYTFTRLDSLEEIQAEGKRMENALSVNAEYFVGPDKGAVYTVDTPTGHHINIGVNPRLEVWNIVLARNERPEFEISKEIADLFRDRAFPEPPGPSKETKAAIQNELTQRFADLLLRERLPLDITNSQTGEVIIPANYKILMPQIRKMAKFYDVIETDPSPVRCKIRQVIEAAEKKCQSAPSPEPGMDMD